MATYTNAVGTTSDMFSVGGDLPVAFRSNSGSAEFQHNAGAWKTVAAPFYVDNMAYVDSTYGSDSTGAVGRMDLPYATIQAAINALSPSQSSAAGVRVRPGTYAQNIAMKDYVSLQGEDPFTVKITGTVTFGSGVSNACEMLNLTVSSTNASALVVSAASAAAVVYLSGVQATSSYNSDMAANNVLSASSGSVRIDGGCSFALVKSSTDSNVRSTSVYYAGGSSAVNIQSIGARCSLTTADATDNVSFIENANTSATTRIVVKSGHVDMTLSASGASSNVAAVYHNAGNGETYVTGCSFNTTLPSSNSVKTFFGYCAGSPSSSKIELHSDYFAYVNAVSANMYGGASTTATDSLIMRYCSVKTTENTIPPRYSTPGALGIYNYIIDNSFASVETGGAFVSSAVVGRNIFINGTGNVQQRPNYTLVNNTYGFGADRWTGKASGTAVTAGTFGRTESATAGSTGHAHKFSGVTMTGTGTISIRTRLEAEDSSVLKNQTVSVQVKTWHDVGASVDYVLYVRKATVKDNFASTTLIATSPAYSVPSSAATRLTFENITMGDCSNGIEFEIVASCGAVTAKNFEFTEMQMEAGKVCAGYAYQPYEQTIRQCQRYYYRYNGTDSNSINYDATLGVGYVIDNSNATIIIFFPTTMRAPPTGVVVSAASDFRVLARTSAYTPTAITFTRSTMSNVVINLTVGGPGAGASVMARTNSSAAYIELTGTEL